MYSITKNAPKTALNTKPTSPNAGLPHNNGPLSDRIASDDPTISADMINDTDS